MLQLDSLENSLNIRKMLFLCVLLTILVPSGFGKTYLIPKKNCYDVITHHNDVIMKDIVYQGIYLIVIYYCAKFHVFSI